MIRPPRQSESAMIELTPMIDAVFLLLIFFLAATTFHQTEREMKVALPEAAAATPISMALREIVVNVDADGAIVVSGRTLDEQSLYDLVAEAVERNPGQKVSIRGDRATPYANVMRALDACKRAGVQEPFLDTVQAR